MNMWAIATDRVLNVGVFAAGSNGGDVFLNA